MLFDIVPESPTRMFLQLLRIPILLTAGLPRARPRGDGAAPAAQPRSGMLDSEWIEIVLKSSLKFLVVKIELKHQ